MNMHMKPFDHDELLKLDGDVPLVRSVPYGIQHALAMFVANLVLPRDMEVKVAASDSSAGPADDADAKGEQPAAYNCPLRAVAMGAASRRVARPLPTRHRLLRRLWLRRGGLSKSRTSAPKSNGSVKRSLTFGYSVKEPCACGFACQNRRAT